MSALDETGTFAQDAVSPGLETHEMWASAPQLRYCLPGKCGTKLMRSFLVSELGVVSHLVEDRYDWQDIHL